MKLKFNPTLRRALAICLFLAPASWAGARYKVLHNFGAGGDGVGPSGPLILGRRGNLYGVTGGGGTGCSGGCGTVFEMKPRANGTRKEVILHNFTAHSGGAFPWGRLVFDESGRLYGSMSGYGSFAVGGAFGLTPACGGWKYAPLYTDGAGPGLLIDDLGNLYGDMGPGQYKYYGAIGELSPGSDGWTYTALYSYCPQGGTCPDGRAEPAPPIWDGRGNLYGTTQYGGINSPPCYTSFGCGVIFKMTANPDGTWTYHVVHRFASSPTDGVTPDGGLVMDAYGNVYGTTLAGGPLGDGEVFKLSFAGGHWRITVVYDFPDWQDGGAPYGTLVFDKSGNLYGEALGGYSCGSASCGVVFKLTPRKEGQWTYTVLHKFTPATGVFPVGVTWDGKGHLFGTAMEGGKHNNAGVAFEIAP